MFDFYNDSPDQLQLEFQELAVNFKTNKQKKRFLIF